MNTPTLGSYVLYKGLCSKILSVAICMLLNYTGTAPQLCLSKCTVSLITIHNSFQIKKNLFFNKSFIHKQPEIFKLKINVHPYTSYMYMHSGYTVLNQTPEEKDRKKKQPLSTV